MDAEPTPPLLAFSKPAPFPTIAPMPAPTFPSRVSVSEAASHAAYASSGPGRTEALPNPRSKIAAVGTIGTTPAGVGCPMPRSSRKRMTPFAAPRPKAEPPVSSTALTSSMRRPGAMASVSLVAGAPPGTTTEPVVPFGTRTTVHPVKASSFVQCPTRTPGTSVIIATRLLW